MNRRLVTIVCIILELVSVSLRQQNTNDRLLYVDKRQCLYGVDSVVNPNCRCSD